MTIVQRLIAETIGTLPPFDVNWRPSPVEAAEIGYWLTRLSRPQPEPEPEPEPATIIEFTRVYPDIVA